MIQIVRNPNTGEVLATLCVAKPLTDEELAAMAEFMSAPSAVARRLAAVRSLTRNTDGDDLHPDAEIPVGEIQRILE
jgi:hypothetical protein